MIIGHPEKSSPSPLIVGPMDEEYSDICFECGDGRPCKECNEGDLTADHICDANHRTTISWRITLGKKAPFTAIISRGLVDVCFHCPCGLKFSSSEAALLHLKSLDNTSGHTRRFRPPHPSKDLVKNRWRAGRHRIVKSSPISSPVHDDSESHNSPLAASESNVDDTSNCREIDLTALIKRLLVDPDTIGRLAPEMFLNDELVEFGLKVFMTELEQRDPLLAKQIHVFSSFFYLQYLKEGAARVETWTRHFHLFNKKYLLFPIHESSHWYLAIACHPGQTLLPSDGLKEHESTKPTAKTRFVPVPTRPKKTRVSQTEALQPYNASVQPCIWILDSLGAMHGEVVESLNEYLHGESIELATDRSFRAAAGIKIKVPIQPNGFDCGIYLLHSARIFLADPDRFYALAVEDPQNSMIIRDTGRITELRAELEEMISRRSYMGN
ncbi:hypothetical protein B0H15DRAFT_441973 [Mycena belliarum]|uniref:Ubiquitin-like protease family profile domain-containing protein n=1 Tax=Mycena belliarum TaxID=1033014 RepID=A0AAD6TK23_9AGAR|nr:hypothetical protein B0H15DRAFT_250492 [Mycena belliae]KAJ7082179.1 hypothetical protein B0H15DRAFT_441973 [Mycena belliae]